MLKFNNNNLIIIIKKIREDNKRFRNNWIWISKKEVIRSNQFELVDGKNVILLIYFKIPTYELLQHFMSY